MPQTLFGNVLRPFAPNLAREYERKYHLRHSAIQFKNTFSQIKTLEERVDYAREVTELRSNQKRDEILGLLRELVAIRPQRLCEIGADRGGTLALFASVASEDARILSVDIHYRSSRQQIYRSLATNAQQITCLEVDSHSQGALRRIRRWLHGELFDFLFIDGDHSYNGVKSDYEMYHTLVRRGGIIAFHDIVPDFRTRFGTVTPNDVGEVPRFWQELKKSVTHTKELIEDKDQDGYGIGIVYVE